MFKVKKGGWLFAFVVVAVLVVYGDWHLATDQAGDLRRQLSTHDIAGGLGDRLRVGMDRASAEDLIAGYRSLELFEANGELTVTYAYWFGFIPPLPPPLKYKVHAKIAVTYDGAGKVVRVKYWHV